MRQMCCSGRAYRAASRRTDNPPWFVKEKKKLLLLLIRHMKTRTSVSGFLYLKCDGMSHKSHTIKFGNQKHQIKDIKARSEKKRSLSTKIIPSHLLTTTSLSNTVSSYLILLFLFRIIAQSRPSSFETQILSTALKLDSWSPSSMTPLEFEQVTPECGSLTEQKQITTKQWKKPRWNEKLKIARGIPSWYICLVPYVSHSCS